MSKLTIGQDGKIYWRDDARPVDTIVRAFNSNVDTIQRLERERDEWRARYEEIAQGSEAVWEGKPTDAEVQELAQIGYSAWARRKYSQPMKWSDTGDETKEVWKNATIAILRKASFAHTNPKLPTPEDAAKFRQNWLSQRHNWGDWEEFSELYQFEHTSAMAATLDWIRKGCPDE